jgi:hypothetical protein
MADTDFNLIKPVEGLQTVHGLSPAKLRDERQRRQKPSEKHEESAGNQEQQDDGGEEQAAARPDDSHRIDYCA